jgi:outer membrane protein TolC
MKPVAALLLCLATSVARAQPDATTHDLEYLTRAAEAHSHNLKATQHTILAAEARLSEATISPFFQFTAEAGLGFVPDANGTRDYSPDPDNELAREFGPAVTGSVSGAIPLYTFGKLRALRRAAKAGVQASEINATQVRNELIFDVRRAYYGLQLALDAQQMLSEGLPKLRNALKQLDQRLASDDESTDEMARYRLSSALAEVEARESQVRLLEDSTRAALQILTGLKQVHVPECPLEPLAFTREPVVRYQQRATADRPEIGRLQSGVDALVANLDAKTAKYFPDLALALAVIGTYAPGRTPFEFYRPLDARAGLALRWDLDFWGNSKRVSQARHQLSETREKQALAKDGIGIEVAARYAELEDAERRRVAWDRGHRDTRRWFLSAAQGYQVGVIDTKELVDAVEEYFKARFSYLNATREYNTALAALELATGRPLLDRAIWNGSCEAFEEDEE